MDRRAGARRSRVDMACGEGYGSSVLARGAASVVGVDANPEAFEHARLRYRSDNLRFERGPVESHGEPGSFDAVVFLQTIEHVQDPGRGAHPHAVVAHRRRGGLRDHAEPADDRARGR